MSAAAENDIKLILAGHIHRPVLIQQEDVTVACAGTAAAYLSADGYWIHKLEIIVENSLALLDGRTNFVWNSERLDFVLHSEFRIPNSASCGSFRRASAQHSAANSLEPDSKDNYRASRLTAIWMQANVTKAARVPARFS